MCWLVLVCPVVSVGGGGEPAEGLVWPVGVVLGSPVLEHDLGFEEVGEVFGVEAFVSEASVEGLDVGVLPGGSGLDVGGVGAPDAAPVPQRGRDELWAVVHAQMLRAAWMARASRVNSSTMLSSLTRRRSAVSSNWKSRAHTSLGRWARSRAAVPVGARNRVVAGQAACLYWGLYRMVPSLWSEGVIAWGAAQSGTDG